MKFSEIPDQPSKTGLPKFSEMGGGATSEESDLLSDPLGTLGRSAAGAAESIVQPFAHPIETVQGLERIITQKKYSDAAWEALKERYGGWDNIKKTMLTDPFGFLLDASTVVAGPEALTARLPGRAAQVTAKTLRAVDPMNWPGGVVKGATTLGKQAVAKGTGGGVTGLEEIYKAGRAGGTEDVAAAEGMRSPQSASDRALQTARNVIGEMYGERAAQYERDMAQVGLSLEKVEFTDIDKAMNKVQAMQQIKGRNVSDITKTKQQPVDVVKADIGDMIANWRREAMADPDLLSAVNFDKLKQEIGKVKDAQRYGSPEWRVASDVYNSIRQAIVDKAPHYAKTMKNYQETTDKLEETTKTLSLGKKALDDTALRKLLSSMRSNVNTNFGERFKLVEELNKRDPTLVPSLAGMTYAPLAPGGIQGALAGVGGIGGIGAGLLELVQGNPKLLATVIPSLLATSPRLWGEMALGAGRAARKFDELTPDIVQRLVGYAPASALAGRAAGAPLRINVGTGEVENAPQ